MKTVTTPSVDCLTVLEPVRAEPRGRPRYDLTRSAVAIPICPDLSPAPALCADGFTWDVSEAGIGFEMAGLQQLPSDLLLTGIEADDGVLYFATVEVKHCSGEAERLHIGARFVEPERDLLSPANLMPTFDAGTQSFSTGLSTDILFQWAELGIFRPVLVDRIFVCPKCGGLPTFHSGCRSCGSIHVASHRLVHHFSCAYLGLVSEFENAGRISCPKCRESDLTENVDYEFVSGPCRCLDCDWSDSDSEVVAQCIRCQASFSLDGAGETELIGYHVNRLDPQWLVDSL